MTVWHLQHHHAGDDMLEVPLGWTFGAIVNDCDTNSKIRARCPMRNEQGYNFHLWRTSIADVQASIRGPPKTVPRQPPTPPY